MVRGGPEWNPGPAARDRMREWRLAAVDAPAGDRPIAKSGPADASQRTVGPDATQRRALGPVGRAMRGSQPLCPRFRRYRARDGETTAEPAVRQKGRSSSGSLRPGGRGDDGGAGRGPAAGIPGPAPISGPAREPSMTNSCTTMSVQYRVPPRSS